MPTNQIPPLRIVPNRKPIYSHSVSFDIETEALWQLARKQGYTLIKVMRKGLESIGPKDLRS